MSGIAGIIYFDGRPVGPGQVEAITADMHYRGSDGIHHWRKRNVALGQCMLRTTPESLEEIQPLTNEDESLVLVMDGRVDNWEELRRELLGKGLALRTRADAELVLRAYEVWGRDCLSRIDGDFALVIWNARRQEAFCARDRFGHRPVYYALYDNQFVFASDFHAVVSATTSLRKVNEGMLAEHLCLYVESLDETLIEGVKRLPPACYLVAGSARFEFQTYWSVNCQNELRYKNESEYVDHFLDLFSKTVRRQTRSISPVGAYLSGGLDSSAILLTAAKPFGALERLDSYSLSFAGIPQSDERTYIAEANQQCGLNGNLIPFVLSPFKHYIDRITSFKDVGEAPNGAMLNLIRIEARKSDVRVMLTGYGGDEWFGKNPSYWAHLLQKMEISELARDLEKVRSQGTSVRRLCESFLYQAVSPLMPEPLHRPFRWLKNRTSGDRSAKLNHGNNLINPEFASRVSLSERLKSRDNCGEGVTLAHRYVHNLLHNGLIVKSREVDSRDTSLFQIEERHPFYDRRMVEFALSLPESMRSRGAGKHVLREAMRGILPENIRNRTDKGDFSHVIAETLLDPLVLDWVKCSRLVAAGYVEAGSIQREYAVFKKSYSQGSDAYIGLSWKIWAALTLEVWLSVLSL